MKPAYRRFLSVRPLNPLVAGFLVRLALSVLFSMTLFYYLASEPRSSLRFNRAVRTVGNVLNAPPSFLNAQLPRWLQSAYASEFTRGLARPPLSRGQETVRYLTVAVPSFLCLAYLPALARFSWSRISKSPRGMAEYRKHFACMYAVAMLVAGPQLLLSPLACLVAVFAFPGGLLAFIEPQYSFPDGPVWPAVVGFGIYATLLLLGPRATKPWPYVVLLLLLLLNVAGCHVQHSHFQRQF